MDNKVIGLLLIVMGGAGIICRNYFVRSSKRQNDLLKRLFGFEYGGERIEKDTRRGAVLAGIGAIVLGTRILTGLL